MLKSGCRCGGPANRQRLPGSPGHIVHVNHTVNSQQQVGAGDADDVKQAEDHQANLLRMQEGGNEVEAGEGDDEDAAGSQDGLLLHHVA